jgi:hypothetical protein
VLVALLIAATLPAAHPPPASVAGVHVSWPKQTKLASGATERVKVSSRHRRAQLSLVSSTSSGKIRRTLARKTLRRGTFRAKVGGAGTYELRLTVARHHYWSWLTVSSAVSSPPAPAPSPPQPVPSPSPIPVDCGDQPQGTSARLTLGRPTTTVGGSMPYRVTNTSRGCITEGAAYGLARQNADGSWQQIPTGPFPLYAVLVPPGGSYSKVARIPSDAQPGRYQITDSFQGLTAEFNVTAT